MKVTAVSSNNCFRHFLFYFLSILLLLDFYFDSKLIGECRQESRAKMGEMRSGHDPGWTTLIFIVEREQEMMDKSWGQIQFHISHMNTLTDNH